MRVKESGVGKACVWIGKSPRVGLGSMPAGPKAQQTPTGWLQSCQALRPDNTASCFQGIRRGWAPSCPLQSLEMFFETPPGEAGGSSYRPAPSNFCVFPIPDNLGWWWWVYFASQPLKVKSQVLGPDLQRAPTWSSPAGAHDPLFPATRLPSMLGTDSNQH